MRFFLPLFLAALCACAPEAETLRVMSFNVRYPNPDDGENYWDNRRDFVVDVIAEADPDLIGTQELFASQGDYITQELPQYQWFGRDRRGGHEDEHMGVFYDPARVTLIESGDFWLSETPNAVGSLSWEMSLPRMVAWGRFRTAAGRHFLFANTHFAHRRQDDEARKHSAEVIVEYIRERIPADEPLILTGDFNAAGGGEVWQMLTGELSDAWEGAEENVGPAATGSGFEGRQDGRRIDWILYRGPWAVRRAETIVAEREGRFPSDHFPVTATLELR